VGDSFIQSSFAMGKNRLKTKQFAAVKRMINPKEIAKRKDDGKGGKKTRFMDDQVKVKHVETQSAALFGKFNSQLKPPYNVIIDTNFINFSIKNKIDIVKGMMDCLYAQCTPHITDCVMAELEKLGQKYRVALRIAKDPRFERLPCQHRGTYADDCICERVKAHRCYIVATCDTDLKRRIRKIPGVPIMCLGNHKYTVERLPEAGGIGNS
jgi:U3 small nucleolar RNA-associated protein 24